MIIHRRVLINLAAFLAVSLGLTAYGAFVLLRNPFAPRTTVKTVLPNTAGLIKGLSASSNGVTVGTVSSVKLNPANNSVTVNVSLDPGKSLPGDVTASVIRANPLGEQSVDFAPQHGGTAPPLRSGATVPVSAVNPTPPSVGEIINIVDNLFNTIPKADLTTVIHQLAVTLNGRGQDLRTLTQANLAFSQEFLNYQSQFQALLANSPPILNAVGNDGPQLQQAIANTVVLSGVFAQHRFDTVHLFANGIRLGQTLGSLIANNEPNLACLLHDFGRITANSAEPQNLSNFDTALATNQEFFGPVDALTPLSTAKSLYPGDPNNHPQNWLRTFLLLPPGQPQAISYNPHHTLPPTKPGPGCNTEFGPGVGPATQPGFQPSPGGSLIPPPASESRVRGNEPGDPNAIPAAYTQPRRPAGTAGLDILAAGLLALFLVTGFGLFGRARPRREGR